MKQTSDKMQRMKIKNNNKMSNLFSLIKVAPIYFPFFMFCPFLPSLQTIRTVLIGAIVSSSSDCSGIQRVLCRKPVFVTSPSFLNSKKTTIPQYTQSLEQIFFMNKDNHHSKPKLNAVYSAIDGADRFQSPVPNKKRPDDHQNGISLGELSPFKFVFNMQNSAPHSLAFNSTDLRIIETPVARSQPRPSLLDQVAEVFPNSIAGVISWGENENESEMSEENQEQSSSEGISSSDQSQIPPPQNIPLIPFPQKPTQISQKTLEQEKIPLSESTPMSATKKQLLSKLEERSAIKPSTGAKRTTCNCKKTKCLKLYCDCFREGLTCDETCNCVGCHNTDMYEQQRNNAMLSLMDRNPLAFMPKIDVEHHSKGCHCKKSNCLKKYCECFQAGIKCGDNCKCEGCKNHDHHEEKKDTQFGEEPHHHKSNRKTAKKERKFTQMEENIL